MNEAGTHSQRPRLMIVDDEHDFAVSTSRALALEGIDCILAGHGAEAVALLLAQEPQIALLDIRIRDEDGTELAARLKALRPDLIVIIMTGYASVDSAIAAMQAGAHDFLRKPFFLDELMRALGRAGEILRLREDKAQAERELTHLRQLEATSQLAAGLSHDFRNMLAVVQANLSVLVERLEKDGGSDARLLPYARDALHAGASATSVVTRLGDFRRNRSAALAPVDLRPQVAEAVAMMRSTLCAGLAITLSLPEEPLMVLADPAMIGTAMVNLLINARDATGGEGRVTVALRRLRQGGDYARLTVTDDGPGLSGEAALRAVDPFFTTKPQGTGLGLPMIRHLALSSGGRFRLENAPQGGAQAVLDLPAVAVAATAEAAPHSDGANI
ncbi:response regulator [Paracoccus cavernae]|uniref:histidine kinase n=1 Tax=Paracoccus cavernae TaxID=1571207 RepID=A0ABT8D5Z0_9RHOB|nr:response regulator [Paracoccus cavernae]